MAFRTDPSKGGGSEKTWIQFALVAEPTFLFDQNMRNFDSSSALMVATSGKPTCLWVSARCGAIWVTVTTIAIRGGQNVVISNFQGHPKWYSKLLLHITSWPKVDSLSDYSLTISSMYPTKKESSPYKILIRHHWKNTALDKQESPRETARMLAFSGDDHQSHHDTLLGSGCTTGKEWGSAHNPIWLLSVSAFWRLQMLLCTYS